MHGACRTLDDATYAALSSLALFNNVEVVSQLSTDTTFLPQLFAKLQSTTPGDAPWNDLVTFLQVRVCMRVCWCAAGFVAPGMRSRCQMQACRLCYEQKGMGSTFCLAASTAYPSNKHGRQPNRLLTAPVMLCPGCVVKQPVLPSARCITSVLTCKTLPPVIEPESASAMAVHAHI